MFWPLIPWPVDTMPHIVFCLEILCNALVRSIFSIGETPEHIRFSVAVLFAALVFAAFRGGISRVKEHLKAKDFRTGLLFAGIVWSFYFIYFVCYKIPNEIRTTPSAVVAPYGPLATGLRYDLIGSS